MRKWLKEKAKKWKTKKWGNMIKCDSVKIIKIWGNKKLRSKENVMRFSQI